MTNLDSILKSRNITLPTEIHLVKATVFPSSNGWMWEVDYTERWRIDAFELWCWRKLLRVPWTARISNQSILKEIIPGCSLDDWCWSWNSNTLATWCEELTPLKRPWCWERLRAGGDGDSKEITLINPKGNQSWIFIGRTDTEAPILWPPDKKSRLTGKDPDAGKDWGQEEKGVTEDEMVG